tara:strand:- start:432 stop:572 length:141 start_codon:yes stop_codon:yes gene_type:complete
MGTRIECVEINKELEKEYLEKMSNATEEQLDDIIQEYFNKVYTVKK